MSEQREIGSTAVSESGLTWIGKTVDGSISGVATFDTTWSRNLRLGPDAVPIPNATLLFVVKMLGQVQYGRGTMPRKGSIVKDTLTHARLSTD